MWNNIIVFLTLHMFCIIFLQATTICLWGDFENQIAHLMDIARLSKEDLAVMDQVHDELEKTLQKKWPGSKLTRFGSSVIGLGLRSSDIDYYVSLGDHTEILDQEIFIAEAHQFLRQYDRYGKFKVKRDYLHNVLNFFHMPTGIECDVIYGPLLPLKNSEVVAYLLSLDQRALDLATVIKIWATVQELTTSDQSNWTKYSIMVSVIFYLQQKRILPPVSMLQKDLKPLIADNWNVAFAKINHQVSNNETLYELLGDYFVYYADFDFYNYAVSPYLGYKINKNALQYLDLPDELELYKYNVENNITSPIVQRYVIIEDLFQLNNNIMFTESNIDTLLYFKLCSFMYKNVDKDMFLRSILMKHKYTEMHSYNADWKAGVRSLAECI